MSSTGRKKNRHGKKEMTRSRSRSTSSSSSSRIPPMPTTPPPRRVSKMTLVNMDTALDLDAHTNSRKCQSLQGLSRPTFLEPQPHHGASCLGIDSSGNGCAGKRRDSYLIPTDPPYVMTNGHRSCSTDWTASELKGSDSRKGAKRFDSGLGDGESEQELHGAWFKFSSNSMPNPRTSTSTEHQYIDIDMVKDNCLYEQQQEKRKQRTGSGRNHSQRDLPPHRTDNPRQSPCYTNSSGDTYSDSEGSEPDFKTSLAEIISRSLNQDSSDLSLEDRCSTLPHTYEPFNARKFSIVSLTPATPGRYCGLTIALITVFLISLAALAVGVYILFFKPDDAMDPFSSFTSFILDENATQPLSNMSQVLADLRNQLLQTRGY